ncbi:hypothetical protein PIIN_10755 [Serendipita indica DSM 11827]|uniref:Uncharacterized protein n=1 Tax=Serendipita indica (strain DSM 11827) TaxID=1109443 RepID=G4TZM5_SERID|nr:hypothetical protein PIIN_10755 [Serendipita indica DSM 11827]
MALKTIFRQCKPKVVENITGDIRDTLCPFYIIFTILLLTAFVASTLVATALTHT